MGLTLAMCVTPDAKTEFLHVVEDKHDLCTHQTDEMAKGYESPITILRAVMDFCSGWGIDTKTRIVINTSKGKLETTLYMVRGLATRLELERFKSEDNAIEELMAKHDPFDELEAEDEHDPYYEYPPEY